MSLEVRPSNGVSYGAKYSVTADDATAGEVVFDFRVPSGGAYQGDLAALVLVTNAAGVVTTPVDLAITYPAAGVIKVAGTLVKNSVIHLVAQRAIPTLA